MKKLARELLLAGASVALVYSAPAVLTLTDVSFAVISTASAAEGEGRRPPPTTRASETLTRPVYERIEKVMALREAEDYAGARVIMQEIKDLYDRDRLNDREKYTLWLFMASLDQAEENYVGAIANYRELLKLPNLQPDQLEQTWFYIGSLHYALEQFREAIDAFNTYNQIAIEPNDDVYLRIATAYYQLEEYQNAVPAVLRNMELARAKGKEIPQSTFGLLRALYLTMEDYPKARQVLREMVVLFNEAGDWGYLAAIEGQMENFTVQGETLFVANAAKYLDTEAQLLNLASQLYNNDNPFGCSKVISEGMSKGVIEEDEDNLSFLATCYQLAREDAKAAPILERAAPMAEDGELFIRLGRVYMTMSEWDNAIKAFNDGLEKGGVGRADQAYLSLARCYQELNRYDDGIAAARNAGRDERSAETSRNWVSVLTNEKARYDTLQRQRRELAQYFR
jgi:tetratricopeptide (TPR) repeat protein